MERDKLNLLENHAANGRYLEVESLLNEGVHPDGNNKGRRTPLMLAADNRHLNIVDLLIKAGADLGRCDEEGRSILHNASRYSWFEVVQSLMDKRVPLEKRAGRDRRTALMIAIEYNNKDIAELLIKSGANIHCRDAYGWTVLHCASSMEDKEWIEVVQYLVNNKVALNVKTRDGRTPLLIAAQNSTKDVVQLFIDSGADIHHCDKFGRTLLHIISNKDKDWIDVIRCLVKKGVSLDAKTTDDRKTPLLNAVEWSEREVVELLGNSGADVQCCDNDGWTPLHRAAWRFEGPETVRYLVGKGAVINVKKSDGKTPLHLAVYSGMGIADYLLKAGADCNLKDDKGVSPFNMLVRMNMEYVETIKLCIEMGAVCGSVDYNIMLGKPTLKKEILQDIKICSQAVINKFNNEDLPLLYKSHVYAHKLPPMDQLKIGSGSGAALEVERAVAYEIQSKGYCNLLEVAPLPLRILCVKSSVQETPLNQKLV